ncbi:MULTISPECIES: phosphatase PAP2 family protein [Winogradskyella]|uniref:Phosphatase PAP2 family protein n=1 Tax=Winogradskyella marincola TaxID=3037795 RepID=A0ABT6FXR7_9FLAO|nr:phosphatase PAP2 family protein [Winogradskyella sp. YYF002]MDG4714589.1 phosphatase PAP2 family protein [Winogradskyella sp. YYF002]
MIETPILLDDIPSEHNFKVSIKDNFQQVRLNQLFVPIILFTMIFCFFVYAMQGSFVNIYVESQKDVFLKLNSILSVYPNFAHNISYLGDALVLFPFVFIFLFIKPKLWEAIIISSLFTLITSAVLKLIFAVPRPAAMINMETFTIMGRPNILHTSLPSGHAMTAFMVISILLYAFMPKKMSSRIIWTTLLITIGLIIGFSRVAVGAHYPLDVVVGCILGYIMAIFGIKITTKLNWLNWLKKRKFYPIIMLIFSIWGYLISLKLIKHNMVIFYLSLSALIVTFFVIIYKYVKTAKA